MSVPPDRLPAWSLGLAVLGATLILGGLNAHNAAAMAPNWGQDLAFFTQIVHRAATGGPWSSPLLLEPEGMLAMVHTHLVLPLVVGIYALIPRQEVLLYAQAAFAALAVWPLMRLGEALGGRRLALAALLAALLFGPFQVAATCDFRPSSLFVPGVIGIFAAAHRRSLSGVLGWALVAHLGRQEASYLGLLCGVALCLVPWAPPQPGTAGLARYRSSLCLREGMALIALSLTLGALWTALKPEMFFHFNPTNPLPEGPPLPPEVAERRLDQGLRLLRSGALLGLLSPAGLVAGAPMGLMLATTPKEWEPLVGPSAHYTAFWVPFVLVSAVAGAARLPRAWGPALLVFLQASAFPWVWPREGPRALAALAEGVGPDDRVAADYDTIHLFGQRAVLWNVAQIEQPAADRPLGFSPWPISLDSVDVVIGKKDDPTVLLALERGFVEEAAVDDHRRLRVRAAAD